MLKDPRKLEWQSSLGSVSLDVELKGQVREFSGISTLHASLILCFEDQQSWTPSELSNKLGISEDTVLTKISFWVSQVSSNPPPAA